MGYGRILSVFAIASICDWAMYTWMPLYLYESFGFSLVKAGFTSTFYIKAGGFAGLIAGGFLADGWARRSVRGRAWTQASGLLLAAPFLVLSGLTHQPWLLYIAMTIFGVGKGMYDGNTMPLLCERVPVGLRATAFGLLNFAGTFAGGVIAATAGALKGSLGLGHTFALCGCLLMVGGTLLLTVPRPSPESAAS
jgi:MFS family permease